MFSPELFNKRLALHGDQFFSSVYSSASFDFWSYISFSNGHVFDFQNRNSRPIGYAVNNPCDNSSWMSRNMIVTGVMILLFMALHFYDFWVPEIKYKYIDFKPESSDRYFEELTHKFKDSWRVIIYCVSFVFLSLHLLHGFGSAFQSLGLKSKI